MTAGAAPYNGLPRRAAPRFFAFLLPPQPPPKGPGWRRGSERRGAWGGAGVATGGAGADQGKRRGSARGGEGVVPGWRRGPPGWRRGGAGVKTPNRPLLLWATYNPTGTSPFLPCPRCNERQLRAAHLRSRPQECSNDGHPRTRNGFFVITFFLVLRKSFFYRQAVVSLNSHQPRLGIAPLARFRGPIARFGANSLPGPLPLGR